MIYTLNLLSIKHHLCLNKTGKNLNCCTHTQITFCLYLCILEIISKIKTKI